MITVKTFFTKDSDLVFTIGCISIKKASQLKMLILSAKENLESLTLFHLRDEHMKHCVGGNKVLLYPTLIRSVETGRFLFIFKE